MKNLKPVFVRNPESEILAVKKPRNFPTTETLICERAQLCKLRVAYLISSNVQSPKIFSQNVQT